MIRPVIAWLLAAALLPPAPATADQLVLDLDAAMARAAQTAPAVIAARGRIGEADAARLGAAVRFTSEPELELEAGPRRATSTTADVGVQLGQTFQPGRRGPRRALAGAERAHAEADAAAIAREVRRAAGLAFVDALYAEQVVGFARAQAELADRAAEVAGRRRRAGEATDLDVELARAAAARARVAVAAADAERVAAIADLADSLGLAADDSVVLRGELRPPPRAMTTGVGPHGIDRPELRALAAEAVVAVAEERLARAEARPELGIWLAYRHEEDAEVVLGGLRLSLPVWDRGRGGRARARAHGARVAATRAAVERGLTRQVDDARAVLAATRAAVDRFEVEVAPALDAAEALLGRSIDAGAIDVAGYLVARQELLTGRREHLELLRSLARADLDARLTGEVTP